MFGLQIWLRQWSEPCVLRQIAVSSLLPVCSTNDILGANFYRGMMHFGSVCADNGPEVGPMLEIPFQIDYARN
jgi:hypothetical protein